jgi:hypothetical protein
MGREVVVAITDGRLDFGPWEQKAGVGQDHRRIEAPRSFRVSFAGLRQPLRRANSHDCSSALKLLPIQCD